MQAEATLGEESWRQTCIQLEQAVPDMHEALLPLLAELAPAYELGTVPEIALSRAASMRQTLRHRPLSPASTTWAGVRKAVRTFCEGVCFAYLVFFVSQQPNPFSFQPLINTLFT